MAHHDSLALAGSCSAWVGCFEAAVAYLDQIPYVSFVDVEVVVAAWHLLEFAQVEGVAASQSLVAFGSEPPYVAP